jgi:hypothetical protein
MISSNFFKRDDFASSGRSKLGLRNTEYVSIEMEHRNTHTHVNFDGSGNGVRMQTMTTTPPQMLWLEALAPPEPGSPPRPRLLPFISAACSLQAVGGLGFRRNLTFFFRPEGPGRATPSSRSAAARVPMRARANPVPAWAIGRDLILPGSPSCRSPVLSPAGRLHRCQTVQSSIFKPSTRLNSSVSVVTNVHSCWSAMAAIYRS